MSQTQHCSYRVSGSQQRKPLRVQMASPSHPCAQLIPALWTCVGRSRRCCVCLDVPSFQNALHLCAWLLLDLGTLMATIQKENSAQLPLFWLRKKGKKEADHFNKHCLEESFNESCFLVPLVKVILVVYDIYHALWICVGRSRRSH